MGMSLAQKDRVEDGTKTEARNGLARSKKNTQPCEAWVNGHAGKCHQIYTIMLQMARCTNSHREVKYSTGNTVDNIVITMHRVRWGSDLSGGSLRKVYV